jgi:hypothetical protein
VSDCKTRTCKLQPQHVNADTRVSIAAYDHMLINQSGILLRPSLMMLLYQRVKTSWGRVASTNVSYACSPKHVFLVFERVRSKAWSCLPVGSPEVDFRVCWCSFMSVSSDLRLLSLAVVAALVRWSFGTVARRLLVCLLQQVLLRQALTGSSVGGVRTVAPFQLVLVSVVVVARWSNNLFIIFFYFLVYLYCCWWLLIDDY